LSRSTPARSAPRWRFCPLCVTLKSLHGWRWAVPLWLGLCRKTSLGNRQRTDFAIHAQGDQRAAGRFSGPSGKVLGQIQRRLYRYIARRLGPSLSQTGPEAKSPPRPRSNPATDRNAQHRFRKPRGHKGQYAHSAMRKGSRPATRKSAGQPACAVRCTGAIAALVVAPATPAAEASSPVPIACHPSSA